MLMFADIMQSFLEQLSVGRACITLQSNIFPYAKRRKSAAGTGTRERGNRERRVEGVRFLRCWGNFVPVLIDFGPFEILLAIKLTVSCAISTGLQTFLKFLLLFKQTGRSQTSKQFTKVYLSLGLPQLMPATTQGEQVSSSN